MNNSIQPPVTENSVSAPTDSPTIPPPPPQLTKNTPQVEPRVTINPFSQIVPKQPYRGPKPTVLLILDGWGIGPDYAGNAIARANTPNMDQLWLSYPHTQLSASGEAVGLPKGEDGNTETGHLNIGAGSIIHQELPRINNAVADKSFTQNKSFQRTFDHIRQHQSTLHIMGLVGAGKVHSSFEHLKSLLDACQQNQITGVAIHAFTDGRDSSPTAGIKYLQQLQEYCNQLGVGRIVSVTGRFYAMDRDKKWDRIEKTYNALTLGQGITTDDPISAIQQQYNQGTTDEFIEPIVVVDQNNSPTTINDNDAIIFFNFRVDRPRELTRAFVMPDFEEGIKVEDYDPFYERYNKTSLQETVPTSTFQRQKKISNLYFVTMTTYDETLTMVDVAFPMRNIKDSLGNALSRHGIKQLRITETEKEKFITQYINGKQKQINPGEDWIIYPSRGVRSYDQVPEMSAIEITDEIIKQVKLDKYEAIIVNICNGDMVGHTGNLEAGIKACEVVDQMVGKIVDKVLDKNGTVLITADHGNVEEMINTKTGEVDTEHSTYPVPFIMVNRQYRGKAMMLQTGILGDIAPTMLHLMGLSKPEKMTGRTLFKPKLQS